MNEARDSDTRATAPEIEFDEMSDDISDVRAWDVPAIVIFVALLIIVGLQFFTR